MAKKKETEKENPHSCLLARNVFFFCFFDEYSLWLHVKIIFDLLYFVAALITL